MVNIFRQKLKSKISINVVQETMEKLFHNFVFCNNDASTVWIERAFYNEIQQMEKLRTGEKWEGKKESKSSDFFWNYSKEEDLCFIIWDSLLVIWVFEERHEWLRKSSMMFSEDLKFLWSNMFMFENLTVRWFLLCPRVIKTLGLLPHLGWCRVVIGEAGLYGSCCSGMGLQ